MRRATSGASIGPLSKQLTPILSVAAHEGPYAFKFKGLTLWLAKTPRLKLFGAFRRITACRLTCAVLEDAAAAPLATETARNARRGCEIPSRCGRDSAATDVTAAIPPALIARNASWCAGAAAR